MFQLYVSGQLLSFVKYRRRFLELIHGLKISFRLVFNCFFIYMEYHLLQSNVTEILFLFEKLFLR